MLLLLSLLTRRAARLHLTAWCIGEELQTCLSNMQLLCLPLLLLLLPASNTQLLSTWTTDADQYDIATNYCVFPFKYKGEEYESCMTADSSKYRPWCSVTSDYDKDGLWGFCIGDRTTDSTEGDACVFPFTYNGKSYSQCTTAGFFPGAPWCATTSDYDTDKEWAYCPTSGNTLSPSGNTLSPSGNILPHSGSIIPPQVIYCPTQVA
ncbi:matrix metalloproteinase-9-like isoform X2 [Megalops cyprinoides]|uniref:matrix metalloproteinase-9-like isoform X2 n=1 Tax=Megalops cyprinoides TaxID=118141 RepID=UPI00186539BC|nr:matrix metalloproteinase-9-like isoform X2 [Megalops cyprinoides]